MAPLYSRQAVPGGRMGGPTVGCALASPPVSSGVPVGRREPRALMKLGGQGGSWPSLSCSGKGAETRGGGAGAQLSLCPRPQPPLCCSSCSSPAPRGGSLGSLSLLGWALSLPGGGQSRVPLSAWDVFCPHGGHQTPPRDPGPPHPPVPEPPSQTFLCPPQLLPPAPGDNTRGQQQHGRGWGHVPAQQGPQEVAGGGLRSSLAAPYPPSAMGSAQPWWWAQDGAQHQDPPQCPQKPQAL